MESKVLLRGRGKGGMGLGRGDEGVYIRFLLSDTKTATSAFEGGCRSRSYPFGHFFSRRWKWMGIGVWSLKLRKQTMNLQICYFYQQHDLLSYPTLEKTKVHTFRLVPVYKVTSLILREGGRFRSGQRKGSVLVKSAAKKKYRSECVVWPKRGRGVDLGGSG